VFWITIDQIKCFQSVIEAGSFTKASEKLMRAKSAVRYAVNNLEEQLGFRLLDREQYRPKATAQGQAFLYRAEKILKEYNNLELYCRQISSEVEMRLAMSVSDIYEMNKIYPIIRKAMDQFPSTEIVLDREILSGQQLLLSEQVDIAVYEGDDDSHSPDIEVKKIDETELVLVIGNENSFLKRTRKEQTLQNLYQEPQIFQRSTIKSDDKVYGKNNPNLQWRVTDTASKKDFIMNSFGWGRLPLRYVEEELKSGKLVHLDWLDLDEKVNVYVGKRRGAFMGKVAQFIWEQL
jgi:DNA-binding transcriptional LysR family regulator